jgi:spore coat protein CotH
MSLVKDVGGKLDSRIKSGEIKESELMEEASELMNKMKNMPGMGNIQSMLSKMGMGNMAGKMNMGAMQSQLNKNMKSAQMRERMKAKAEANQKMKTQAQVPVAPVATALTEEQLISIFSTGEKVERTPRGAKPVTNNNNNNNNNNNKNKKKKGKK